MVGWLAGWLVGWVGWLVGWLDGIQKVIAHFKDEGKSIIGVINDSLRDLLSQDVKDAMEDFVDVAPDLVKQALVRKTKLVCCHQPRLY